MMYYNVQSLHDVCQAYILAQMKHIEYNLFHCFLKPLVVVLAHLDNSVAS